MKKLLIVSFSLTIISAAAMGIIGKGFHFKDNHRFSIMDLEMPGSEDALVNAYKNMDEGVLNDVRSHLHADYFFMVGCYTFIAMLCIAVAGNSGGILKKIFLAFAALQAMPFLFDVVENILLERWIPVPGEEAFTFNFMVFQTLVVAKFTIAVSAFVSGTVILIYRSLR
jgi:hypothetical protein